MTSKTEEEFRRLSVELRLLEQTAEAVQSRINMVNAVLTDLNYASMTLEGLEKEKEDVELLVPIGGGSYIKAKLSEPDKLIVSMGAGVSVEKTRAEAKEIIKKRSDELGKTQMALQQQFAQVIDKINENRSKIEEIIAQVQKGKATKDV
ncbi:MAG: prefoldin subunit alpha [Candidatus Bathyarchaeia archaeon]